MASPVAGGLLLFLIVTTMGLKPSPSGESFRFCIRVAKWVGMENYRSGPHSRYDLKYHFVWVTKYRKPVLVGEVGLRLRELVRELSTNQIEILQGAVSRDQYIFCCRVHRTCRPARSCSTSRARVRVS